LTRFSLAPAATIHYRLRMFVQELPASIPAETLARVLAGAPGLAWLDSDGGSGQDARYSFVTAGPVELRRSQPADPAPFHLLDELELPEAGGGDDWVPHWIGYVAYDAYPLRPGTKPGPGLCFARYEASFAIDHARGRTYVVGDDEAACERLRARLAPQLAAAPAAGCGPLMAADPAQHARAIGQALERIGRGEIYQVNLARRFWAHYQGSALALGLAMRRESPVPLGMFFDDGQRAVVARSMERFLRWQRPERRLHTRPIKGTLARAGRDPEEQTALRSDPKEHAEHAMIVDLMRNDLGRVAAIGSVHVEQRFAVEPFARLHHMVSTIACTTRPEVRASDILYATFPPGSVTGTPKLRAIDTISALEPVPRGIYTGALGFVDRAGGLSLSVAIRTAVVEGSEASYFAGGGIVEASHIAREIAETELKARVFVDALRALPAVRAGGFEPP
jgi:para-aminobenzoate synthetase component 1